MVKKVSPIDSNSEEYWKKKYDELESKLGKNADDDIYISPDKNIRVISLCNNKLNLTTGTGRDSKSRVFDYFGQSKLIPYSMLVEMIEANPTFAEDGVFYILDKDVIRKIGLSERYEKILRKEDIEKIFQNSNDALALYKTLNPSQREVVNEMLIEKVRNGEITDLTLISSIEREGDVEIMERVKLSREFLKQNPQLERMD